MHVNPLYRMFNVETRSQMVSLIGSLLVNVDQYVTYVNLSDTKWPVTIEASA